ncbi:G1/S-specific cyclin-D2-like [Schistocerca serialis cubense]|uniref:G1/S-specific cyclin-D2-like n=1 Tax=Schistocerca serialis cubense TaxID=2023355 RepID=UPI00214E5246|nr:G1/S-specific cyclin-D2-like [Schistocerca serialis cubense]
MNLLCVERLEDDQRAERDSVIYDDSRVFKNLLEEEKNSIPPINYFVKIQKDIKPFMRKIVATWMMEVCQELQTAAAVFPQAVNLLDRFLCGTCVRRTQLQALACACLLIAAKLRQCCLPVTALCHFTDNSVPPEEITALELVVLSRLQWRASAVTAVDLLEQLVPRLPWAAALRRHALSVAALCCTGSCGQRKEGGGEGAELATQLGAAGGQAAAARIAQHAGLLDHASRDLQFKAGAGRLALDVALQGRLRRD